MRNDLAACLELVFETYDYSPVYRELLTRAANELLACGAVSPLDAFEVVHTPNGPVIRREGDQLTPGRDWMPPAVISGYAAAKRGIFPHVDRKRSTPPEPCCPDCGAQPLEVIAFEDDGSDSHQELVQACNQCGAEVARVPLEPRQDLRGTSPTLGSGASRGVGTARRRGGPR